MKIKKLTKIIKTKFQNYLSQPTINQGKFWWK